MKIKTSFIPASILRDQRCVSRALAEQIDSLPPKADVVYLQVERAAIELKAFMSSSSKYHKETYELVLKEIEYFANHST